MLTPWLSSNFRVKSQCLCRSDPRYKHPHIRYTKTGIFVTLSKYIYAMIALVGTKCIKKNIIRIISVSLNLCSARILVNYSFRFVYQCPVGIYVTYRIIVIVVQWR